MKARLFGGYYLYSNHTQTFGDVVNPFCIAFPTHPYIICSPSNLGIPVAGGALNGLDALYATVQMPSGVPVATVAVGSAGPTNAALLAVQILGTSDASLREKFRAHKETLRTKVAAANEKIHA